MISYYLDNTIDDDAAAHPSHELGRPGRAGQHARADGGLRRENLQITYDMVDGVTNPSSVRMVAADFTNAGACAPQPCSPNQIRKMNVFVAGRSTERFSATGEFFRNTLTTQVSLRSLALVDRYQ
jgi:hypothetical protein